MSRSVQQASDDKNRAPDININLFNDNFNR